MYLKLAPNSKVPVAGEWQLSETPWRGFNNGRILPDRTVVDFDDIDLARDFYRTHPELCTNLVRTRRAIHAHFSGTTRARKLDRIDIKSGEHAYVVVPDSTVDGHTYEWIRQGDLLPFPESLFPDARKEVISKQIRDVRAYVAKIESIQGQNGSAGLVRAAARCRDAGVPASEATLILLEWNSGPTVSPPWPAEELARAITRVYEKGA